MKRLLTVVPMVIAMGWSAPGAGAQSEDTVQLQASVAQVAEYSRGSLDRPAGFDLTGETPAQALATVRERTGIRLLFSPSLLPEFPTVNCQCRARTVRQTLEVILAGTGFRYSEENGHVLIEPEPNGMPTLVAQKSSTPLTIPVVAVRSTPRATAPALPGRVSRTGTIVGQVIDEDSRAPIATVQIQVLGTNLGTTSDADGRFSISNVPAGEREVRAQRIGYRTQSRTVQVTSGASVPVSFTLRPSVVDLDEIVVTGRGMGVARREIGASVARINTAELEAAPITSMSNLLQARSPGVHILGSGGQPGQGSRILLRGIASLSQSNTPVIYVDGVRMDNSPYRGIRTTGPSWAGFDDINPADIESIEIVRGASAATLYGTEAAAGVINITTRRGRTGAAAWRLRSEIGSSRVPDSYWEDSGSVFSDWYIQNMGTTGSFLHNQLSVRGGTEGLSYYASGTMRDTGGIEPNSQEDYAAFRTNLGVQATDNIMLQIAGSYTSREVMVPPQGNNQEGFLINGLLGGSDGWFTNTLGLRELEMFQRGDRYTAGVTAEYTPGSHWSHRLTLGGDFFNSDNTEYLPPEALDQRWLQGYAGNYRRRAQNLNVDLSSTFRADLTESVRSTTTAGFQWFQSEAGIQTAYGEDFPFRGLRVVSATSSSFAAGESRSEEKMLGAFVEQQFGWNDRLFVTVGARADGHSAFGADVDYEIYPKVDVSYVVSQQDFWNDNWGSLRLRGAYGTAGMQPSAFSAVRTYGAVSGAGGLPAVVASNVGNPALRPEVSKELELGFDADILNDRLSIEFTFYDQTTEDALYQARNIPSQGVLGTQLRNVGEVHNRGLELALNASILDRAEFRWDARASLSTNENEVVSLSGEAPLTVRWLQHIREGFPIGGFFASNHLIEHEGQVVNKSSLCAEPGNCTDAEQYIGPAQPTRTIQLGSDFSIGQSMSLGFFFDHHGGHFRHDHTMRWTMDPRRNVSEDRAQRHGITPGPVSNVCRNAAEGSLNAAICGRNSLLSQGEFAVPADFWRLREVTLAYRLPGTMPQRLGLSSATVTLAGRNLWRSMKTPQLEPESNLNSQSTLQRHAFFPTPVPQQFILGITVEF